MHVTPWDGPRPPQDSYAARFTAPLVVDPRSIPIRRNGIRPVLTMAGVAGIALVALAAWFWWPSGNPPEVASTPPPPTIDAEAQQRLAALLPAGYTAGACTPAEAPEDTVAVLNCPRNADAGGPATATFTLLADDDALQAAFDDVVSELSVVNCPGNIQSPVLCPTGVSKTVWGISSARMGATVAR